MFRFSLLPFLVLGLTFLLPHGQAESIVDRSLLYTVGEIVTVDNVPHAYLAWQGGDADAVLSSTYAIYAKPGLPSAPAPFIRLGTTTYQSSPSTALSLLRLGYRLDARGNSMRERIETLFRDAISQPGASLILRSGGPDAGPGAPTLDTAEKLLQLLWAAAAQPDQIGGLLTFGRTHPGVMLTLGQAYAVPLTAPVTTFEVRLLDGNGADLRVVGRVTLDQAAPPILPAPGPALIVPHTTQIAALGQSPKDHLVARLRWSMSDALRDALPATNGYDLYRLPRAVAESRGWHLTPPTPNAMLAAVADGSVTAVNQLPVFASPLLSAAAAANATDRETFHYADDNQQVPGRPRLADGDQYYYFVATRTYTARPGLISPGSLVTIGYRLPPRPPEIVRVENTFTAATTPSGRESLEGTQRLKIIFRPLPDLPAVNGRPDPRQPSAYHLYRWDSPRDYLLDAINPVLNPARIATLPHVPGGALLEYVDAGPLAPGQSADFGRTYYYTARAVDSAAGVPNYGYHSGPAFGVLRDRVGPPAPYSLLQTRELRSDTSYVTTASRPLAQVGTPTLTSGSAGFGVQLTRLDTLVEEWEMVVYRDPNYTVPLGQASGRFPSGIDEVRQTFPVAPSNGLVVQVRNRSGVGTFSSWATANVPGEAPGSPLSNAWRLDFTAETNVITTFPSAGQVLVHDLVGPQNFILPISGQLSLDSGLGSWRIYRRIGIDGELELIANGQGEELPNSAAWSDATPPVAGGTEVCYFAQTFDLNGNPSPLTLIECVTIRRNGADLPVPILTKVKNLPARPDGRAEVQLEWFSDPVSVERFEILAAARDAVQPGVAGPQFQPVPIPSTPHPEAVPRDLQFTVFQTTRVGGGLGNGPNFTATALVPADQALVFAVRAVGSGQPNTRPRGKLSNLAEARWLAQPAAAGPVIPWPQRPLPGLFAPERAVSDFQPGEGPLYATALPLGPQEALAGIVIGYLPSISLSGSIDVARESSGGRFFSTIFYPSSLSAPETYILRVRSQGNTGASESIFPFVVYRYQMPSPRYPAAVPNLVQVSPRIDRISHGQNLSGFSVRDPFLAFLPINASLPLPLTGTFRTDGTGYTVGNVLGMLGSTRPLYVRNFTHALVWKDPMPAARGARYRYLMVQFDADGEIKRILPTNPVVIVP